MEPIGKGDFGEVFLIKVRGENQALKSGRLGPYEAQVLACGSKAVPELKERRSPTTITMEFVAHKVDLVAQKTFAFTKDLVQGLLDVNDHMSPSGIVHCDLKPDNIRITEDGTLKILDWGLAAPPGTHPPSVKGAPFFLPPEATLEEEYVITSQRDCWAIGIMLFQALSSSKQNHPITKSNYNRKAFLLVLSSLVEESALTPSIKAEFQASLAAIKHQDDVPESVYTVMNGFLDLNPKTRLTLEGALKILQATEEKPPLDEITDTTEISSPAPSTPTIVLIDSATAVAGQEAAPSASPKEI